MTDKTEHNFHGGFSISRPQIGKLLRLLHELDRTDVPLRERTSKDLAEKLSWGRPKVLGMAGWARCLGLVRGDFELSPFGRCAIENEDLGLDDPTSLWAMHVHLVCPYDSIAPWSRPQARKVAIAWVRFWNEFLMERSEVDLIDKPLVRRWLDSALPDMSEPCRNKTEDYLINTYCLETEGGEQRLGGLGLLAVTGRRGAWRKSEPRIAPLPEVAAYFLSSVWAETFNGHFVVPETDVNRVLAQMFGLSPLDATRLITSIVGLRLLRVERQVHPHQVTYLGQEVAALEFLKDAYHNAPGL